MEAAPQSTKLHVLTPAGAIYPLNLLTIPNQQQPLPTNTTQHLSRITIALKKAVQACAHSEEPHRIDDRFQGVASGKKSNFWQTVQEGIAGTICFFSKNL